MGLRGLTMGVRGLSSTICVGMAVLAVLSKVMDRWMPSAWRRSAAGQPYLEDRLPQFVMCETPYGVHCRQGTPARWLADFFPSLQDRARATARGGRTPIIMHVGANDFTDDTPEYQPIVQAVQSAAREQGGRVGMVLVEPGEEKRDKLSELYPKFDLLPSDVKVVISAMKYRCDGTEAMWIFSDQLFVDFAPDGWYSAVRSSLRSWRSFHEGYLAAAVYGVATLPQYQQEDVSSSHYDVWHHVVVPTVRRIYQAGNLTEYIVREPIECMSAPELLQNTSVEAGDIVMFTVDAEGTDLEILGRFIELPDFQPVILRWEGSLRGGPHSPDHLDLAQRLQRQGYRVGESGQGHSNDLVLVRES